MDYYKLNQKEVISNLQYKEIIEKEKIGRNYKIKLIKEIENI